MGISTDFNYTDLLSLDKAKLVKRKRLNFLGSKELILDYNLQTGGIKEEAVSWLEENRLSLVDPSFGFKTYEGTWYCIDIEFNEDAKIIRQRFKIDSSLVDDVSERSASGTVERSYYWRIVDPDSVNIPESITTGEVYTKTANDNGDGTYDVIITKRSVPTVISGPSTRETALYTETTTISINNTQQTASSWAVGTIVEAQNTPQENGLYRTVVTVRTAKQFVPRSTWTATFTGQESTYGDAAIDSGDAQNTHLYIDQGYFNDYLAYANSPRLMSVHNVTKANVDKIMAVLTDGPGAYPSESVNYVSVSINEFGLYDINITRRYVA